MSHLISKSFRAFATIGRQSRLQNAQRATCRLFSDKSDEVKPPAAENQAAVAENVADKKTLGGFAKAFEKYTRPAEEPEPVVENRSFAQLLRESKFVDLGDPKGKIVSGKIVQIVEDDLYIDFGWKFNCVCTRPERDGSDYVRGAIVRLRINDLELSSRFLGSDKDLTILEADCSLMGLIYSPARPSNRRGPKAVAQA